MTWTPAEVTTALWIDANDPSKTGVLDSEFIFLEDISGNGHHLTRYATTGPALDSTTFADMTSARFSGQVMEASSLGALTEAGVFIVVKIDTDPNTDVNKSGAWKFGGNTNDDHYRYTDGNIYDGTGSTSRKTIGNVAADLSAPHIYNINSKSGLWEYRYNSLSQYETLTNTVGWAPTTYIGGYASSSRSLYGVIGEIIVTPTFPTAALREKIEGYLAHKWGIATTLPTNHPYKAEPPETEIVPNTPVAQVAKVSGTVQIDGTPAERTVRAFGYDPTLHDIDAITITLSKSLGHARSAADTGAYTIDLLGGYGKEVFVVAFDDYGAAFVPNTAVAVGDRIHPTTPDGHVYECIGAGTLPSTEPTWIVDTATSQLYGTASMIARVFYRPMVHGPVAPEVTGVVEPTWTPANLFAANEAGAWYDPSDLTTMFQDEAGTVPVTANGDPVGLLMDKSGNNNHLKQVDSSLRPFYKTDSERHWLEGNGIEKMIVPGSAGLFNFLHNGMGGTSVAAFHFGRSIDPSKFMYAYGNGGGTANAYGFTVGFDGRSGQSDFRLIIGRNVNRNPAFDTPTNDVIWPNTSEIIGLRMSTGQTPNIKGDLDGATMISAPYENPPATTNASYDFQLFGSGSNNGYYFDGRFYGGVWLNTVLTDSDMDKARNYLADKSGVTL